MYQHVQGRARPPIELNPALPQGISDLVMRTMDSAIEQLYDQGLISGRSAFEKAINKGKFEPLRELD